MPHIRCTIPNASHEMNGVQFEAHPEGGVVSVDDVPADMAAIFLSVKGFEVVEPKKQETAAERKAREKAEKAEADAKAKAEADAKAKAEADAKAEEEAKAKAEAEAAAAAAAAAANTTTEG